MYTIKLSKSDKSIRLVSSKNNIVLRQYNNKNITLQQTGRSGPKGDKGDPGGAISNLFIQDSEPTITEPSLWIQTESGQAKTLWLVTED